MFPKKIILNFCFELLGEGQPCFIPLLLSTFLKRYKLEQLKVIQVWMVQGIQTVLQGWVGENLKWRTLKKETYRLQIE